MKTCFKNLFLLRVLITGLGLMLTGRVTAQIFTTLHSFTATSPNNPFTNTDGTRPVAGLILLDSTLYGTTVRGGTSGAGIVFAVGTNGTGFTNLHSFDGAYPNVGLFLAGDTLYGTTPYDGSWQAGTVFRLNVDGTGFTNLYSFTGNSDGALLNSPLILSGQTLYGTSLRGGSSDAGIVFGVGTNGTGFTNLYRFTGGSDGGYPHSGLVLYGNTLYGSTYFGGSAGKGTVFAINTDGTGFANLYSFTGGSDGAFPYAGLILSGNTLYGTTVSGGGTSNGTVFAVNTDGTGFANLYSFTGGSDGGMPQAGLILAGNTLYGTAINGGSFGNGTVFGVNTDGTGFMSIHSFTATSGPQLLSYTNSDGATPYASLALSGNTLYGTAAYGGSSGNGTVFSIFIQPKLTLIPSGPYVILTWPTNYTGFTLQSNTNLVSTPVWATVSPGPVVIGGQNVVVNTISGTQQFFRLSQ